LETLNAQPLRWPLLLGASHPPSSMRDVSIRHADPDELDKPGVANTETRKALRGWWNRWERLPTVVRDRPVAEVLAEERNRD